LEHRAQGPLSGDDRQLHSRPKMPVHPSRAAGATQSADGRRTVIALVSAALISLVVLALLAIFDVK